MGDGPFCGPLQVKLAGNTKYLSTNKTLEQPWVNHTTKLNELSNSMWEKTSSMITKPGSAASGD